MQVPVSLSLSFPPWGTDDGRTLEILQGRELCLYLPRRLGAYHALRQADGSSPRRPGGLLVFGVCSRCHLPDDPKSPSGKCSSSSLSLVILCSFPSTQRVTRNTNLHTGEGGIVVSPTRTGFFRVGNRRVSCESRSVFPPRTTPGRRWLRAHGPCRPSASLLLLLVTLLPSTRRLVSFEVRGQFGTGHGP